MPILDGLAATDAIRAQEQTQEIGRAHHDDGTCHARDRERCLAGRDGWLCDQAA